ncbi:MAG TPA: FtsQ-type POTRA domain-containing protein [Nitrospira sp.]|nr:FtsQ-type POTRA domain-containing protein [Nitrospira sp.]
MKIPIRRQPAKAIGYRSNQWKGARAIHSKDHSLKACRSRLAARCRKALRLCGWLAVAATICWAALLLMRQLVPAVQHGLEITEVSIEGIHQVTKEEVLNRLPLKKGIAQHQVSLAYFAERLRTHPWIKEATVERLPLHALRVTIVERKPAAIARTGSEQLLIDEEGVVLARLGEQDQPTLPLLFGVDGSLLAQGDLRLKQRLQSAIQLAKSMAEALDGRIEIDVSHPVNIVASAKGVRFHFGSEALKEQWDRFVQVKAAFRMPAFDGRRLEAHDVDLRYDHRVIVRERG